MNNIQTVTVNDTNISIKEYNGKRVVTFKDIDTCHGRPEGTARRNFNQNKHHLIEGEDYFRIAPNEFRTAFGESSMSKTQSNEIVVVTESGYLMIVKSLKDDLAWQVQRQLVNTYFRKSEESNAKLLELQIKQERARAMAACRHATWQRSRLSFLPPTDRQESARRISYFTAVWNGSSLSSSSRSD